MAPRSSRMMFAVGALVALSASALVMCNPISGEQAVLEIEGRSAEGGLGPFGGLDLLKGLGGPLGDLLSGKQVGGGVEKKLEGALEKKIEQKEEIKDVGLLGLKGPFDFAKVLFNPFELVKQVSTFFQIEKLGLIDVLGKTINYGIEVALQPVLLSIRIIEKIFVPDVCKLKFVCELGRPFSLIKDGLPKLSSGLLDGASSLKALTDGILGHDCEHLYMCGGQLKLKKEFEQLKSPILASGGLKQSQEQHQGVGHESLGHGLEHHHEGDHHHEGEHLDGDHHHEGEHFGGEHHEGEHHEGEHHDGEHFGGEHTGGAEHVFAASNQIQTTVGKTA